MKNRLIYHTTCLHVYEPHHELLHAWVNDKGTETFAAVVRIQLVMLAKTLL